MASLNKPGSGVDLIKQALAQPGTKMRHVMSQPSSGVSKVQKNIHTTTSRPKK